MLLNECVAWHFRQWDGSFLAHGTVQWSIVSCDTPCRGTSYYMLQFWWSGPNCGPQKRWILWALTKELHVTTLACYFSVWKLTHALFQRVWLPKLHKIDTSFFVHAWLVHKQKTILQSQLVYCSPFQSQDLASLHGILILPLIYHSLMDVTQFSLVWIASPNTQFSFLLRWVIWHRLQLR